MFINVKKPYQISNLIVYILIIACFIVYNANFTFIFSIICLKQNILQCIGKNVTIAQNSVNLIL